jgi:hypothetical protein
MKLAIMQPYPFPYIGYFELMAKVDRWVVFDVVQYNRRSWMNRNRILHPANGWQYFSIPVEKRSHGTLISDIRLADKKKAEETLLAQLLHYRCHAPHFAQATDLVRDAFSRANTDFLVDFNVASLVAAAERLEISFAPEYCSRLGINSDHIEHAGQWALQISMRLGANTYLNPPGGREIFRPEEWKTAGVKLSFTKMNDLTYNCAPYVFELNLSILDVLMWNDTQNIRDWLQARSGKSMNSRANEVIVP